MGGVETALVFAIRLSVERGADWPLTLMAVLAAVLLALGVMEQYLAIFRNRSVEGVSFLFCGIDALGDVTSMVSVAFEPTVNVLGLVMYGVEFLLWCGIFACGFWLKSIPYLSKLLRYPTERTTERRVGCTEPAGGSVSIHDMPSSMSVFRTVSGSMELRERRTAPGTEYLDTAPSTADPP